MMGGKKEGNRLYLFIVSFLIVGLMPLKENKSNGICSVRKIVV